MLRKSLFLIITGILFVSGLAAQAVPTTGKVQDEASRAPIAGATLDFYRIESGGTKLTTKTDSKGEFSVAGTVQGKSYIVVVSAPNYSPTYLPNVPAGNSGVMFVLSPGDGRTVSEAEVRQAIKQFETSGAPTAEQRAEAEKMKAKAAEIEAKNARAKADFELARRLNDEAKAAFDAKNYAVVIAKSDEAIAAVPSFVGITPRFLLYRGASLRDRAADAYNKVTLDKAATPAQRADVYKTVRSDLAGSLDSFSKAWTMLTSATVTEPTLSKTVESFKEETSANAMSALRVAVQAKQVDATLATTGKGFLTEYIAKQTDTTKKGEALVLLGGLLYQTDDYDGSVAEYRKALELLPDNPDALFGISIALITSGSIDNNKAKYQEAANFLAKFETVAKGNPKYAALVEEVPGQLAALKSMDVVPEKPKAAPTGRRKT